MTRLVSDEPSGERGSALRQVRLRRRMKVSRVIALFAESLERQGEPIPSRESLKRMFAYWGSGDREVTRDAYQRAFCEIDEAPPDVLGFMLAAKLDEDELSAEVTAIQSFPLYQVDDELVELFESQTQDLRMLDRRLGADALAVQVSVHIDQVAQALRRSVAGPRAKLAECLAEAAALGRWQALDRLNFGEAWDLHDLTRSAARESANVTVLAHVSAQQSCVLLDSGQPDLAVKSRGKGGTCRSGQASKVAVGLAGGRRS